jgi:delta-aminolevulinic acid dehydratase/porphobilinogen synthase
MTPFERAVAAALQKVRQPIVHRDACSDDHRFHGWVCSCDHAERTNNAVAAAVARALTLAQASAGTVTQEEILRALVAAPPGSAPQEEAP